MWQNKLDAGHFFVFDISEEHCLGQCSSQGCNFLPYSNIKLIGDSKKYE